LPLIKDEQVRRYWTEQIAKTDQKTKSETMGYFLSKFDKFTTNLAIRNIIDSLNHLLILDRLWITKRF
jgi:hypothetical protein